MKRSVIPSICLVIAIVFVGCTKSPPSSPKAPSAKDSGPQKPAVIDTPQESPDTVPAAPTEEKPAAPGAEKPATDAGAGTTAAAQPDMAPPTDVTPAAPKLPFEDLVGLLGIEQASAAYRRVEAQVAQNPQDVMARLQLASLLNAVGRTLANSGNKEKAVEACLAALDQSQLVQNPDVMARLQVVSVQNAIGRTLADAGNKEKAQEVLLSAFDQSKSIENPPDVSTRVQIASVQASIGMNFVNSGNQEKAIEVFLAGLDHAQAASADPQALGEGDAEVLSMVFYNGACAQSLSGKPEDAKATLQKSIEMGYGDLEALRNDADLAAVRALPDFEQQMTAWQALIAERLVKEAQKVLATGETFPFDFSLTDLGGQSISRVDYLGKVLIVDIWGTWCPPCRVEIPLFVRLQTEYGPQGLQIVGLNYEQVDTDEEAKGLITKFMQENGMNYPCAIGTKEIQTQVPAFRGFPTTLFIDRTGKVRAKVVGSHEYGFLEAMVKVLLAEVASPPAEPAATPPAAPADTPPAAPADTPPAAPAETPPAAPAQTPPADPGAPPAETPPAEKPPTDAPAEPGK